MNTPSELSSSQSGQSGQSGRAGFLAEQENASSSNYLSAGRMRQLLVLLESISPREDAAAVIENIAFLQLLADHTSDAIYLRDSAGRYWLANAPYADAARHTVDEMLGRTNRELFHHEVAERLSRSDKQVLAQGEPITEETILGEAESARVFLTTKVPFRNSEQQTIGVLGVMREQTTVATAEVGAPAASPSPVFSEQILQQARGGIAVLNDQLRFVMWNPFLEEFIGIAKLKVHGKLPLEIFPTAGETGLLAHLERALHGTTINRVDFNLDTARGARTAWASCSFSPHRNAQGEIVGVICTFADIGEYKKAESALRRSQQFNQQIISHASYGIVVYDRELRYMVWNPAMEEMSGMAAEQVTGRRAAEILPHAQEAGLMQMLQQALKGDAVESIDFRLSPHKAIWVRAHFSPLRDADEKNIGVIGLVTNVTARRQAEEALRDSKQFNEQIINSSLEGIAVFDRELHVLVWNPAMAEISGKPRVDVQGKTAQEIFPHARGTAVAEYWEQALAGEVVAGKDFRFPSNETSWASAVYGPMRNQRGQVVGMIVTVRDITARRRAEAALRESRQFSEQVLNSTLDAIAVHDTDLNYVLWNPAMERLTGFNAADALSKHPLQLFPQIKENGVYEGLERALRGESMPRADYAYADGHGWYNAQISPLRDEEGAIAGVITVLRDVTDRHTVEEALRASQQLNEQVIQTVKEGIIVYDREGRYLEWNAFMEALIGIPRGAVIGKTPTEVFPALAPTIFSPLIEGALRGEAATTPDFELVVADDKRAWVTIRYEPLRTSSGEIIGGLGVLNDVTERKQAEDALRASHEFNAQIIESAREGFIVYGQDFKVRVWNRFMEEVTGLTQAQALGKHPQEVFPYLRTSGHLNLMSTAFSGDSLTGQDFKYVVPATGKTYWLSARYGPHKGLHGETIGVIVTLRDVTARRYAEHAIRESEERYRNILDSIQDGYYEFNLQGELIFFNDALCRIYGADKTEMYGHAHRQWISRETHHKVVEVFSRVLETQTASPTFDFETLRKGGEKRIHESSVTLVYGGEGKTPVGYRGLVRDVTERRTAEARVKQQGQLAALRADVIAAVTADVALPEMLQRCVEAVIEHLGVGFSRLWLLDQDETQLEPKATAGTV
ncbi:MAG: PAS domain S-box protein, partial [Acidobacteria bacterium]|nr:PAS domain S-box protein [Acidobacteriota bacterium]